MKNSILFPLLAGGLFLFFCSLAAQEKAMEKAGEKTEVKQENAENNAKTEVKQENAEAKDSAPVWSEYLKDRTISFVRLRTPKNDWDFNFGAEGDGNLLKNLNSFQPPCVFADKALALSIPELAKLPAARRPPLLYVTGSSAVRLTDKEIRYLRRYLLIANATLVADSNGDAFPASVLALCTQLFPDLKPRELPADHPIFQKPFALADGVPEFIKGRKPAAFGVFYQGRAVIVFCPGSMSEFWRPNASGKSKEEQLYAFRFMANLFSYSADGFFAPKK